MSFGPVAAATVSVTNDPARIEAFEGADPALRLRAFTPSQEELYVGRADLGQGANRSAAHLTYGATGSFTFAYSAATGLVSASYGSVSRSFQAARAIAFNALRIDITGPRNNSAGGLNSFSLGGVTVNGQAIPDLTGSAANPRGTLSWVVSRLTRGDDMREGDIMVRGTLAYAGPLGGNGSAEGAKVDLRLGTLPPVPLPPGLAMLLLALTALALAARRRPQAVRA